MDGIQEKDQNSIIKKHENCNARPSCCFNKSPLNSSSLENMNGDIGHDNNTLNLDGYATEVVTAGDVILINLEIGEKKLENVAINSQCLLQDLAEELAENETIQVVYFLNETIKKGGGKCDVMDSQVLVRIRPQWKWIPIEDLVDDLTQTVEEVFTIIPDYYQIVFSLAPRPQRAQSPLPEPPRCNSNEDNFVHMVTDLQSLFDKYPTADLLDDGDSSQEMATTDPSSQNSQELKQLLTKVNTLLKTELFTPVLPENNQPTHQHKQTQSPDDNQPSSTPHQWNTPLDYSMVHVYSDHTSSLPNPTIAVTCTSPPSSSQTISSQDESSLCFKNTDNHSEGVSLSPTHENLQEETIQDISMESNVRENSSALSRVRVQFDKGYETPLLRQWFNENPVPSKNRIDQYVKELNERRKGKEHVTYRAVYIWFKNTRARCTKKKPESSLYSNTPSV